MSNYALIREAVIQRQPITCTYKGLVRHLCTHVIGKGKDGSAKALSLQFAGETSSGQLPDGGEWRCMAVDEMLDVKVTSGGWHTLANHSRPQSCVKQIDVEVAY
ncbi:MAG: hypothetical protein Q7T86_14495 [Hyphomicrobiaceae bacterium]|nr:hypothetical protein [Hyphomicrobiaceae bacterium]